MIDALAIGFAGHHVDFDLDYGSGTWTPVEPSSADLLDDEGMFPLIGMKDGRRYELYSDGTFNEVEL